MVSDLYPFQSHFVSLHGLHYHYLDEGAGEPIILLHGNPTWSFYYRRLILALRDSYRCIVPDHIGCGLSDKPSDSRYRYTLSQRVKDLEALVDHLEVTSPLWQGLPTIPQPAVQSGDHATPGVTLVLHDWGGMIGIAYASRRPEAIRRLVILNTAAFHLPKGKRLPWSLRLCRHRLFGPFLVRGLNAFCRGAASWCCRRRPMAPEVREAYLSPYNSWKNRIAILRFVQDIPLRSRDSCYDLVSEVQNGLHRFRQVPMLICWGEKDFVFDQDFLAEWIYRFPEAEVHRFPDAGHYVLEDAAEEIIPLVREFLEAHPIQSASP